MAEFFAASRERNDCLWHFAKWRDDCPKLKWVTIVHDRKIPFERAFAPWPTNGKPMTTRKIRSAIFMVMVIPFLSFNTFHTDTMASHRRPLCVCFSRALNREKKNEPRREFRFPSCLRYGTNSI